MYYALYEYVITIIESFELSLLLLILSLLLGLLLKKRVRIRMMKILSASSWSNFVSTTTVNIAFLYHCDLFFKGTKMFWTYLRSIPMKRYVMSILIYEDDKKWELWFLSSKIER